MNKTELLSLIASGEGLYLDLKQAVNSDLGKTIASFANSKGGQIIIGVTDKGEVLGHKLTNSESSKIQDFAQACDPAVDIHISRVDFSENTTVTIIAIPASDRAPHRSNKGYFLRQGSSSIKMGTVELIQYINAKGRLSFDDVVYGEEHWKRVFDIKLIDRYFSFSGIPSSGEDSQSRILRSLRAISADDLPTNAGILFFTDSPRDFFPQSFVTCVAFKGATKIDILDRQILKADVLNNVEDSLLFLKKHLNFSRIISKGLGRNELEIPETALREAVVNAIIHRDYNIKGGNVAIEVYGDRVEISSPGPLPPGLDPKDFGNRSLARNSVLSDIMSRTPYMERLGSGIQRIRESLKRASLEDAAYEFGSFTCVVFKRGESSNLASIPVNELYINNLEELLAFLEDQSNLASNVAVTNLEQVRSLLLEIHGRVEEILRYNRAAPLSKAMLLDAMGLSNQTKNRRKYIDPMVTRGLLALTIPDNETDPRQSYRTTEVGIRLLEMLQKPSQGSLFQE